jgi:predicted permease
MTALLRDVRFAVRTLARRPGFALTAIGTLALGIGAPTAIFSVVNTTFLRALPYPDPDALVWMTERNSVTSREGSVSYPNFLDWRAQQDVFSALSIYQIDSGTLRTAHVVEKIPILMVSDGFFTALGVRVTQGRGMVAADDRAGAAPVGWVSHAAWRRYFAADPHLVGRAVSLDGRSIVVAGILPAAFRFIQPADMYVPLAPYAEEMGLTTRMRRASTFVVGRLKPGARLDGARTQMEAIALRLQAQYPEANAGIVPRVMPLHEHVAGSARRSLMMLLGAVGAVLLIVCVNLATMLLARAVSRRREMAIRVSLGASGRQLMRQLLVESLLLAAGGGAAGGLVGLWVHDSLLPLVPSGIQQLAPGGASLDARVLLFIIAVTLATGIAFGLAPAWQLSHASPSLALKGTESAVRVAGGRLRSRDLLVVGQVTLAFALLVGAGLMIRSLGRLTQVDPGFQPERVLTLRLTPPPQEQYWRDPFSFSTYYEHILEAVASRPEVERCAVITTLPFSGTNSSAPIYPEGRPEPAPAEASDVSIHMVSADYFRAMGIPLVRGRLLSGREPRPAVPPGFDIRQTDFGSFYENLPLDAVVSQRMAAQYWPGEDPVGKRFTIRAAPNSPRPVVQIVGVVGSTTQHGLDYGETPEYYLSLHQVPMVRDVYLVVRSHRDPADAVASIRATLKPLIGDRPITDVQLMIARIAGTLSGRRFNMGLLTFFSATALLLAVVGVYGVLAFTVSRETREIGVRMALGASRTTVLRGVMRRGLGLVLPGILVGLAGAWGIGRLLHGTLFGITGNDPATYVASISVFSLAAFLACLLPANRAANVDPSLALRRE